MSTSILGKDARSALFATAFSAIVATSFCFVLRALVVDDWGREFSLSATQKGELLGAGLWPFAITIILISLVIDRIGIRITFWFAGLCHIVGLLLLLGAHGYWMLYAGTFIMALGNGSVEAAANPLVATVFAHDRISWLNRLHAAWPAGLILGGLLAIALGPDTSWRIKISLTAAPMLLYLVLSVRQRFPISERVASGFTFREMLSEAGFGGILIVSLLIGLEIGRLLGASVVQIVVVAGLITALYAFYVRSIGRPLFLIMMLLMIPLAITELSTDSWISSLLEPEMHRLGLQAGWVLVYMSVIVFGLRLVAGRLIHLLSPFGLLALGSLAAALGIYLFSFSAGAAILVAATIYAVGKSFFWATSLGVAAEQFPKGGALTLNVLAGSGMLAAGIVGSVFLGMLQDSRTSELIANTDLRQGTQLESRYLTAPRNTPVGAFRGIDEQKLATASASDRALVASVTADAKKQALRDVAILPVLMALSYFLLMLHFRRRGGAKPAREPVAAGEQA